MPNVEEQKTAEEQASAKVVEDRIAMMIGRQAIQITSMQVQIESLQAKQPQPTDPPKDKK